MELYVGNPIGELEFMVECECHCSFLRFCLDQTKENVYLIHYGYKDHKIKGAQDFVLSKQEIQQILRDLRSKQTAKIIKDFAGLKKFNKKYKNYSLTFNLVTYSDEGDRYIEIDFSVKTKHFNKNIIGWGIIIPDKNVDIFLKKLKKLSEELI